MVADFLPIATANSFNMVDHHQQLQKDYNVCNCHRVALLVRDLSPPSVANTACFESLCSLTFVSVSILSLALFLLNTSSHSARCRLVSVSIFLALFCLTPRVALLVNCPCTGEKFPTGKYIPASITRTSATYPRPALNRLSH